MRTKMQQAVLDILSKEYRHKKFTKIKKTQIPKETAKVIFQNHVVQFPNIKKYEGELEDGSKFMLVNLLRQWIVVIDQSFISYVVS